VAAGFKQAAEFRFYEVDRTEPGSTRLRVRHRGQSIERGFAKSVGAAEFVSIGALGGKPVGGRNSKPIGVHNATFVGRLGTESDWTVGKSSDSQREHASVVSKRQHAAINSEREFTPIFRRERRKPFGRVTKL
jgi:hypothetical protein